jgi:hypothetical protein
MCIIFNNNTPEELKDWNYIQVGLPFMAENGCTGALEWFIKVIFCQE